MQENITLPLWIAPVHSAALKDSLIIPLLLDLLLDSLQEADLRRPFSLL